MSGDVKVLESMGVCPCCKGFPEGPWSTGGDFECECGCSLFANCDELLGGERRWRFTFAEDDGAGNPVTCANRAP